MSVTEQAVYLICKYGGFYRPDCRGYTASAITAGRYTLSQAIDETHPNGPKGPRDGMTFIHEDDVTEEGWHMHRTILEALKQERPYTQADYDAMKRIAYQAGYYQAECNLPSQVDEGREVAISISEARDANLQWAVKRWNEEVLNRPLVNIYRRTLDDIWRSIIRRFGGDPEALIGPDHDRLCADKGEKPHE